LGDEGMYKNKLNKEEGAAAVEMAIILPALVMIIFGIFQFGLLFNNYLAITHAAREGARMASVGNYSESVVIARAIPAIPDSVVVSYSDYQSSDDDEEKAQTVTVTVKENYNLDIPFYGNKDIPLSSSATMMMETFPDEE